MSIHLTRNDEKERSAFVGGSVSNHDFGVGIL